MTCDIYSRLTEVRTCGESFLKVSVVYSLYKLLSHADGLWSVFLPLSAHKLMNEIADESQRLARNPFWQGCEKTGSATPWYPFHEEVSKEKKTEKNEILKLVNVAMSGLPAEIFLAISVVVLSVQVSILRCTFPALSGHVLH